jgi:hypothetical protein
MSWHLGAASMKFTTLIPTRLNDGNRVPVRTLKRFMEELTEEFGGCSEEGLTRRSRNHFAIACRVKEIRPHDKNFSAGCRELQM